MPNPCPRCAITPSDDVQRCGLPGPGLRARDPLMSDVPTESEQPVSVLVCRGCCCGTERKLPGVDHAAHVERLRSGVASNLDSRLRTVDCLGPCDRANVVVVRRGQDRWWFGDLHDDGQIDTLSQWLASPVGPPPAELLIEAPNRTNPRQLAPERGEDLVDWLAGAFDHGS